MQTITRCVCPVCVCVYNLLQKVVMSAACGKSKSEASKGWPGIRVGVANREANLRWYVGYDSHSVGMHNDGGIWHNGTKFIAPIMDRDCRTASFNTGDVVTVTVDADRVSLHSQDLIYPHSHKIFECIAPAYPYAFFLPSCLDTNCSVSLSHAQTCLLRCSCAPCLAYIPRYSPSFM